MSLSQSDVETIEKVVTNVYRIPHSAEFREPVFISYPELLETYLDSIQCPMDLGSILLKLRNGEYSTKESCAADISLVFENAIHFNPDLTNLVANAKALRSFASALWSELVDMPFVKGQSQEEFAQERLSSRRDRLDLTRSALFSINELTLLGGALGDYRRSGSLCEDIIDRTVQMCSDEGAKITLSDLAKSVVDSLDLSLGITAEGQEMEGGDKDDVQGEWMDMPCFLQVLTTPSQRVALAHRLREATEKDLAFLSYLEELLGEVSVHLEEKVSRGYFLSAVWARPFRLVWAQPNKSPWWPGMVLAGGDMSQALSRSNLDRLPPDISKALMKLKHKTKDDTSKSKEFVPPGSYLVEYFGTHDFGWIKVDKTIPYPADGKLVIPPELKGNGSSDKITGDANATVEAQEAYPIVYSDASVFEVTFPEDLDMEQLLDDLGMKLSAVEGKIEEFYEKKKPQTGKASKAVTPKGSAKKAQSGEKLAKKSRKSIESEMANNSDDDERDLGGVEGPVNGFKFDIRFREHFENVDVTEMSRRDIAVMKTKLYCEELQRIRPVSTRLSASLFSRKSNVEESEFAPLFDSFNAGDPEPPANEDDEGSDKERDGNTPSTSIAQIPRKRKLRNSNYANALSSSQASTIAFHGCTSLARHKRKGKTFSLPTMHPREVDFKQPIFSLEGRSREFRKRLLKEELLRLHADLESIRTLLVENGKSIDFDSQQKGAKVEGGRAVKKGGKQKVVQTVIASRSDEDGFLEPPPTAKQRGRGGDNAKGSKKRKAMESPREEENQKPEKRAGPPLEKAGAYTSPTSMMPF